jgi:predicted short-subunit dehydrogenase-like oxidoreductase (DUF2520 family)
MARKPSIAIVGAGRLGSTLARELSRAGYEISEIIVRDKPAPTVRRLAKEIGVQVSNSDTAALYADLVWFCVPDRQISKTARQFASRVDWKGRIAFHSSGALTSGELGILRRKDAAVASVHPLMTFVAGSRPSLRGVPFALEGDAAAVRSATKVVRSLGGYPFAISKNNKVAYHAWGFFLSPLLVEALVAAEQVALAAGLSAAQARKKMLPIVRQTIANYAGLGPAGAFSGPLIRGDVKTVEKHLSVLRKVQGGRDVYLALARIAIRHLPVGDRQKMKALLGA